MRPVLAALPIALASLHVHAQTPGRGSHALPSGPSITRHGTQVAPPVLTPLTPKERGLQLLQRFTFGPRPGDLGHLLSTGADAWFERQLDPDSIPDPVLSKRLADYPTLTMEPDQALLQFPDRALVQQVAEGKHVLPSDLELAAVYEVQIAKYQRDLDEKKVLPNGQPAHPELILTDDGKAAQKKLDQATANRIAGELYALPKDQRMAALLKLPVPDRIAFTSYVAGEQRNLLIAQFTPRDRELFYGMSSGPGSFYQIVRELAEAKLLRAILSERQLEEVMTDFWFNHFNVFVGKDSDQWYTTSYERDAIRKHALGHFRDLLLATATSPAMMVYLDNWLSVGPDSVANGVNPSNQKSKRGNKGLNENYGRELMELHTLGVNGGYTQADVTALSAILTGWTVDKPNLAGPFVFDRRRHEPDPKQWLGHTIGARASAVDPCHSESVPQAQPQPQPQPCAQAADPGFDEGLQALDILARSPQTAHFISFLIAQRFVADAPPPALVDRLASTYTATDGDIKAILRTLVQSPEFNSRPYFRNKVKTPLEFLASAFRSTATDPANPGALVATLKQMGMPVFNAPAPTGYYITADQWMNSTALVDRLNFAYALAAGKYANQKFDAARVVALGLLAQPAPGTITGQGTTSEAAFHPVVSPAAAREEAGADIVLHTLEDTLIGLEASPETDQLVRKEVGRLSTPATTPGDTLNLLTALILGSPDFQRR